MRSETVRIARPSRRAAALLASLASVNTIAQVSPPPAPPALQGSQHFSSGTSSAVSATAAGSALHISSCQNSSQPAAGLATRNIVKAWMDGNTGFALDPVDSQELASGRLAPRETSIAIHHR